MKKDDLVLLLLVLFLLVAAVWTVFFGGAHSRHGVGVNQMPPERTKGFFLAALPQR